MNTKTTRQDEVVQVYKKRSGQYDSIVKVFDLFRRYGFDISAWRASAVQALHLNPGDNVVDIGCGTGLNFPLLYERVGPAGKIIAVDLSPAMLEQAQQRVLDNHWQNVELVCEDAAQYPFPAGLNAILSTYAFTLVPDCGEVVARGCQALPPGGRLSILDMAWPDWLPVRWWRLLFWLKPLGLTREILDRKPWESVWQAVEKNLADVALNRFWYGLMYQTSGARAEPSRHKI